MRSSASLYTSPESNLRGDRVRGEVEKRLLCQTREPEQADALKAVSPWGRKKCYSNCSRGRDPAPGHSWDGLVVRLVGVSIITLQVQLVWGLHTCGRIPLLIALYFFLLEGFSVSANSLKILLCVSVDGKQEPTPRLLSLSFYAILCICVWLCWLFVAALVFL